MAQPHSLMTVRVYLAKILGILLQTSAWFLFLCDASLDYSILWSKKIYNLKQQDGQGAKESSGPSTRDTGKSELYFSTSEAGGALTLQAWS